MRFFSKILLLFIIFLFVPPLVEGEVPNSSGVKLSGLEKGKDTYAAVGQLLQMEAMPFSPRLFSFGSWTKCSADSTIWLGGPNPDSTGGILLAVTQPGEISVGLVDSSFVAVEDLYLHIASPGLYHLEIDWVGEFRFEDGFAFLLAKGDTLTQLGW